MLCIFSLGHIRAIGASASLLEDGVTEAVLCIFPLGHVRAIVAIASLLRDGAAPAAGYSEETSLPTSLCKACMPKQI